MHKRKHTGRTSLAPDLIAKDGVIIPAVMSVVVVFLAAFVLIKYKPENLSPVKRAGWQTEEPRLNRPKTRVASQKDIGIYLEEKKS